MQARKYVAIVLRIITILCLSTVALAVNTGLSHRPLLEPTLFLIYINHLPKDVNRSFANIYAYDIQEHLKNSWRSESSWNLLRSSTNFSVEKKTDWLHSIPLKPFHHHWSDPELPPVIMNGRPHAEKILELKRMPDLK